MLCVGWGLGCVGKWIGELERSGKRLLLRDDGGLDQGISCGEGDGKKWILSGYILKGRVNRIS